MKASAFAVAVAAASVIVAAAPAAAASADDGPVTWSVAPATADGSDGRSWIESELDPGESVTEFLAIRNLGEASAVFDLTAADGYFTETGRFNMLQSGQESVDAGTWISVDDRVEVESGETAIVPFTISVPQNATPGDHAAGIAASVSTTGTTSDGTKIGVDSRVGFRVITQVTGELAPQLSVSNVSAEYLPSWNPFTPGEVSLNYTATNAGNTQLSFGEDVGTGPTTRGDLFPGESRTISVEPFAAWPLGPVSVDLAVQGVVPSDETLNVESATTSLVVWAIPWVHLGILAAVIVAVSLVVLARKRNAENIAALLEEARAEGRREQLMVVRG